VVGEATVTKTGLVIASCAYMAAEGLSGSGIMRRGIASTFDDVIAKGMAKDPATRDGSAGKLALAAILAVVLVYGGGSTDSEPRRKRRPPRPR
jgi:hypothetical protein